MFKNLKEFVESKIGRPLRDEETIGLNFKCESIVLLEAYYENDTMCMAHMAWSFISYKCWLKEQGKE